MRFAAFLILIFLGAFTGTALAADVVAASDPSLSEVAKAIFDAVMQGQWWAAASLGVIFACAAVRRYVLPASWKTGTKGDIVGTVAAFVMAFAGALATVMLAPGATMTAAVALTAAKIGIAAVGGYTLVHKVVGWLASWGKMPAWAMSALRLAAMMVGSNAVAKAEAAGAAAVAAKPPTGMTGDSKIVEIE